LLSATIVVDPHHWFYRFNAAPDPEPAFKIKADPVLMTKNCKKFTIAFFFLQKLQGLHDGRPKLQENPSALKKKNIRHLKT
jgi:hypothetical protein